ncbi:MAG: flagellar biosynthetic protein FliO [Deltaproteobacteria bacterium]|nr:flagellar biosynthetic protein FliO [Deltaproteobacteria bacterium]
MNGPSLAGASLQMISALAIVLAIMLVILHFIKKYRGRGGTLAAGDRIIKVMGKFYIDPKKYILVVDIMGERLVLAVSDTNVSFLTKLASEDAGEQPAEVPPSPSPGPNFRQQIRAMMGLSENEKLEGNKA